MTSSVIPPSHEDLLVRPLYAHLATLRSDGSAQVNPMWLQWDGTYLRFTTSSGRRKYRNVVDDPRVALSINDPENPYRYLEVRGRVVRIDPDPEGAFYVVLADRYGRAIDGPPADAPQRVVLVVEPTAVSYQ